MHARTSAQRVKVFEKGGCGVGERAIVVRDMSCDRFKPFRERLGALVDPRQDKDHGTQEPENPIPTGEK